MDEVENVYDLDLAGHLFAYGYDDKRNSVIRLTVNLKRPIDKTILQESVNKIKNNYPGFFVRIVEDERLIRLAPIEGNLLVVKSQSAPLIMSWEEMKVSTVRIFYDNSSISLEFFHGIADANGGLVILKDVLTEYFQTLMNKKMVKLMSGFSSFEDSYQSLESFEVKRYTESGNKETYIIKDNEKEPFVIQQTTYLIDVNQIKEVSQKFNVTVTQLIAAIQMESIQRLKNVSDKDKRVKLLIPVDLRNFVRSSTLRNFVWNVSIVESDNKAKSIADVAKNVQAQMKQKVSLGQLVHRIKPTVWLSKLRIFKGAPLAIKKFMFKNFLNIFDKKSTMTLSNIGVIQFSEEFSDEIESVTMGFSPKPNTPYTCGVATFKNALSVVLTKSFSDARLENMFENILSELSIKFTKLPIRNGVL